MNVIAIVLVCFACGSHGHRVQMEVAQAEGSMYEKHQSSMGAGDFASSTHSRTSLNQSSSAQGAPLKRALLMALLAASQPANAEPWFKRHGEPLHKSKVLLKGAKGHSAQPRSNFGHHLPERVHKDDSDIGKVAALRKFFGGVKTKLAAGEAAKKASNKDAFARRIRIIGPSTLTARTKDIYDLHSGEILFLSKRDRDSESLQTENNVLQAIQNAGISVAPHKLIKVRHPKTGNIVKGMIQKRIRGKFVNFEDEPDSPEKLVSSLSTWMAPARFDEDLTGMTPEIMNLKEDLKRIDSASNRGYRIKRLQGIVQTDGHFILVNPFGIRPPRGKYIGKTETEGLPRVEGLSTSKGDEEDAMQRVKRTLRELDIKYPPQKDEHMAHISYGNWFLYQPSESNF